MGAGASKKDGDISQLDSLNKLMADIKKINFEKSDNKNSLDTLSTQLNSLIDKLKTESAKTESETDPEKTEVTKTEAAKTESEKTEATKTEAAKTEAAKTEAAKTEAAKTEPLKTQIGGKRQSRRRIRSKKHHKFSRSLRLI